MSPLEHGFIRLLDDLHRTADWPGAVLLWSSLAAGILLFGGLALPTLLLFTFSVGRCSPRLSSASPFAPGSSSRATCRAPTSAGEALQYRVLVENRGRRPARNLVIEERGLPAELRPVGVPPLIERLDPGERAEVTLRLDCKARGAYTLSRLQAGTLFPAGLDPVFPDSFDAPPAF